MGKLTLTAEQGERIAKLREEGLQLWADMNAKREALESAEQREKAVEQAAIMEKVFTYADDFGDEDGNLKGRRITDAVNAWEMGEDIFMREYLPIVQSKWRELYGLEYPLNYSPTFTEYRRPYLNARTEYRKIAVRFLRIVGKTDEADEMERALNGYMRESLAERLDKINEQFIFGFPDAIEKAKELMNRTEGKA